MYYYCPHCADVREGAICPICLILLWQTDPPTEERPVVTQA
jgi:hypothetical protein